MKNLLLYLSLITSSIAFSQEKKEFTLNQALEVGCTSGVTDAGKKISVETSANGAKFTHANMSCSKSYDGKLKIDFGSGAVGYLDLKAKKGIVLDGSVVSFFIDQGGKYKVAVCGHEDKKQAKSLSTEEYQKKYTAQFSKFDELIANAQEAEKKAKMEANMLPVPSGNYTDKHGISGLYYFSEPSEVFLSEYKEHIYINSIQLELVEGAGVDPLLKAHYRDGSHDKFYIFNDVADRMRKGQEVKLFDFTGDNMNLTKAFKGTDLQMIEEGVWIVHCYGSMTGRLDCSIAEYYPKKDKGGNEIKKFFIIGKDKARVEELSKDYNKSLELASAKRVERCEYLNALEAAKKPMPAPGMKNAALLSEITTVTKLGTAHWPQKMEYCYIKGSDWVTIKNKYSGLITGRILSVIVVMKTDGGKCQWEEVSVAQDFDGANYGKTYYRGNTQIIVPVDCATAMKYK